VSVAAAHARPDEDTFLPFKIVQNGKSFTARGWQVAPKVRKLGLEIPLNLAGREIFSKSRRADLIIIWTGNSPKVESSAAAPWERNDRAKSKRHCILFQQLEKYVFA
jgi:hypothetical protein